MNSPCYGCKDRHQHCHMECESYAEWDAQRKAHQKKQLYESETIDFLLRSKDKVQRRK